LKLQPSGARNFTQAWPATAHRSPRDASRSGSPRMATVIDLTGDDAQPAAPPPAALAWSGGGVAGNQLTLDSDSDGEAPATDETQQPPPAAADDDDDAPMAVAPKPPGDAPAPAAAAAPLEDADDAPMAPAADEAAPDETLVEPPPPQPPLDETLQEPAPPRRARAASEESEGEPKRQRVDGGAEPAADAPAPPDESEASSKESHSKRRDDSGDEGQPPAAPPDSDDDVEVVADAPAPADAPLPPASDAAPALDLTQDSSGDDGGEAAAAPAPAPANDDETQLEDDIQLAIKASNAQAAADARRAQQADMGFVRKPLTTSEFKDCLEAALRNQDTSYEEIEDGSAVRAANGANSIKTGNQTRAQYGRILVGASADVAAELGITSDDVALDIGSGIGNWPLQMAACCGCEARGLELIKERNIVGVTLNFDIQDAINDLGPTKRCGHCELRQGDMKSPDQWAFLTEGVTVVFVNNYNDVMGLRSTDSGATLDDHICAVFAALKPGARMLTLHPMLGLGPSREEANAKRRERKLPESDDASFFSCREIVLKPKPRDWAPDGEDVVSWGGNDIPAYFYERTAGSLEGDIAAFLCLHRECFGNEKATAVLDDDSRTLVTECVYCEAPRQLKARSRRQVTQSTSSRGLGASAASKGAL